jgi:hypothetical protein
MENKELYSIFPQLRHEVFEEKIEKLFERVYIMNLKN